MPYTNVTDEIVSDQEDHIFPNQLESFSIQKKMSVEEKFRASSGPGSQLIDFLDSERQKREHAREWFFC